MPFNGSGVFTRLYKWVSDAAAGLNVDATRMDADSDDIASGLTNCLTRDGQSAPTTDISWASHKIKDLANGTSPGDAVNYSQLSAVANETIVTLNAGTTTLTADAVGKYHIAPSGTSVTGVNLPLLANVVSGNKVLLINNTSAAFSVSRQGSDTITAVSGSGTITSISMKPGSTLTMVSTGSSWSPLDGSAALTLGGVGILGSSAAAKGFLWVGNILIQWMTATAAEPGSYADNNYAMPFPNAFYSASATHYGATETANVVIHNNTPNEKTAIRLESSNATGSTVFVIAIGS